jgi:predicted TIM-barrel fold metal-dependent hydrolase
MPYVYDKEIISRINTATFQGQGPDRRVEHMDRLGIDILVVSIPAPGADCFAPKETVSWARAANDSLADLCKRHHDRFVSVATLPTSSIKDSLVELDRMVNELGLRRFGCDTNLNGKPLDREELFLIDEKLAKLKLPVYLHPTAPLGAVALGLDIMPILIYSWAFDSTVAMTRLVYGRVLERFPEINFVVADVGGVLSFFVQRGPIFTLGGPKRYANGMTSRKTLLIPSGNFTLIRRITRYQRFDASSIFSAQTVSSLLPIIIMSPRRVIASSRTAYGPSMSWNSTRKRKTRFLAPMSPDLSEFRPGDRI